MGRFADCESCAFHHVEEAICDTCIEADQWESDDAAENIFTTGAKKQHVARFYKERNLKTKEAA